MPTINLLPWREELRQKRKRDFLIAAFGAVLLGGALTFGTKFVYQSQIAAQNDRNNLLRSEIAELDRQIEEINELDAQKSRLLARWRLSDRVQTGRQPARDHGHRSVEHTRVGTDAQCSRLRMAQGALARRRRIFG